MQLGFLKKNTFNFEPCVGSSYSVSLCDMNVFHMIISDLYRNRGICMSYDLRDNRLIDLMFPRRSKV